MVQKDRYYLFMEYFNKRKFMSAQTTLDEVWIKEEGDDKDFLGGLIQVAVSLYHLTNDNPKGALKIYEKAREMLEPYAEEHRGVNLGKLRRDLEKLYGEEVNPDNPSVDYLKLVPRIEFEPTM